MKKILVIDDSPDVITLMEILLTVYGYTVQSTSRGEEAFDKALHFEPGLILLDVNLGEHDGRTICKELKSHNETKHIPVILFSAENNLKINLDDSMAVDFIAKPFAVEDLISKLELHYVQPELSNN